MKTTNHLLGNNTPASLSASQREETMEERFIKWAEARDDDWWEGGTGHFDIWDARIMFDFIRQELAQQKVEDKKEWDKEHNLRIENEQWLIDSHKKVKAELKVGNLRQWLNEDRITDPNKMVTNEEIEHMLGLSEEKKEVCKCKEHSLTCGFEKQYCCDNCPMIDIDYDTSQKGGK